MNSRYPRSIIFTLCLGLLLAISGTILVNARHADQDGFRDKARSAPVTLQRHRSSGVL